MTSEIGASDQPKVSSDNLFFDLIGEAYRVLMCSKPHGVEVCTQCCMDSNIGADFFRPAISELPLTYIQEWYLAAYDPEGISKGLWSYLLPRILELLAIGEEFSPVALELSLSRFDTGNPAKWSRKEWYVIDKFQRAYLDRALRHCRPDYLDDVICMFRLGGWSLSDLLQQVNASAADVLAQRLWHDWCDCRVPQIWMTAFWPKADSSAMLAFYTSPELHARMVTLALEDDAEEGIAAKAGAVAELIEMYAHQEL